MKADPKADASAASNPKTKLVAIIVAAVLALGVGAGAAWYFASGSSAPKEAKAAKVEQPEYVALDPFTVNLLPGESGDQYLQVQFTLQVPGPEAAELIKNNMALVRNRVLLLLSGKHATDINTVEGKQHLANEIVALLRQPFVEKGPEPKVSAVLFTAFIIQ